MMSPFDRRTGILIAPASSKPSSSSSSSRPSFAKTRPRYSTALSRMARSASPISKQSSQSHGLGRSRCDRAAAARQSAGSGAARPSRAADRRRAGARGGAAAARSRCRSCLRRRAKRDGEGAGCSILDQSTEFCKPRCSERVYLQCNTNERRIDASNATVMNAWSLVVRRRRDDDSWENPF